MLISRPVRCLLSAAMFFLAPASAAQPPRQPLSPVLLKRLAEAVDGHRTGEPVYVVASYNLSTPVHGVFGSRSEAARIATGLGPSYDVFGPYMAPRDLASSIFMLCKHDGVISYADEICPPTFPLSSLQELTLVARFKDGTSRTIPVGVTTDAIFMSLPAIDKFVIPYYARTIGVDSAAAMRARIVRGITTH